jgi:hypothetical protein
MRRAQLGHARSSASGSIVMLRSEDGQLWVIPDVSARRQKPLAPQRVVEFFNDPTFG